LDKEDETGKVIYVDGFSRNPAKHSIIPDYLFFQQEEERVDLSQYGLGNKPVRGLIEILNNYNFTIDENTPIDQEIALDPELLGNVFENLLASYNPETATTARKATGSYYTPREIVDYMVEASLFEYLKEKLHETDDLSAKASAQAEEKIKTLLSYSEENPVFSKEEKQKIISAIDEVKILDPACGSGAFPMGILHKLVSALQKLDPDNEQWKELQYQKALKESEEVFKQGDKNQREERLKEINETFDESINYPDYARKLYLIENCIYGVDIQPIAIQISKLRFFISLVLDQKVDRNKENFGIRALPNLETRFVSANTLLGLDKPQQMSFKNPDIEKKEEELKQIRHKYFEAKTRKEKLDYQKKDAQIRKEIADLLKYSGWDTSTAEKIAKFDLYDQNASADFFDPEWMFGVTGGFDIVIANPPYVRADNPEIKKQRDAVKKYNAYETLWEKWDLYVAFIERGYKILTSYGILEFIIPDAYMTSKYAIKSHRYFLENALINRINFCSELKIFEVAVRNIIIEYKKAKDENHIPLRIKHINEWNNFVLLPSKKQSEMDENTFKMDIENNSFGNLSNALTWGEICYVSYGLRPSNDERFWKGEFTKEDLISDVQDKIHPKPYIEGKWINKYVIEKIKYLEWETKRSPKKLVRPTFPELYLPEKIIKGRMTPAILDNSGLLCNDSCFVSVLWKDLKDVQNRSIDGSIKKDFKIKNIYPFRNQLEENSRRFNLKYLLAILNSQFAYKFLDSIRRSQIGFYPDDLKKLPIKIISKSDQQPFISLVDKILSIRKDDDYLDNPSKQAKVKEYERQIDQRVYELYGLTEDEIKMVER
ncbi:MAG: Eco57I restriction-modification methylase domain-containing protein, partial [bacterium]